jgi:hypothetical protein
MWRQAVKAHQLSAVWCEGLRNQAKGNQDEHRIASHDRPAEAQSMTTQINLLPDVPPMGARLIAIKAQSHQERVLDVREVDRSAQVQIDAIRLWLAGRYALFFAGGGRMTHYAIQLTDFMVLRHRDPALGIVLAANAERQSVRIGKERFDEEAVTLACPAQQASALVELIRTKYRRDEVRIWRNDTGAASAWRRV